MPPTVTTRHLLAASHELTTCFDQSPHTDVVIGNSRMFPSLPVLLVWRCGGRERNCGVIASPGPLGFSRCFGPAGQRCVAAWSPSTRQKPERLRPSPQHNLDERLSRRRNIPSSDRQSVVERRYWNLFSAYWSCSLDLAQHFFRRRLVGTLNGSCLLQRRYCIRFVILFGIGPTQPEECFLL